MKHKIMYVLSYCPGAGFFSGEFIPVSHISTEYNTIRVISNYAVIYETQRYVQDTKIVITAY